MAIMRSSTRFRAPALAALLAALGACEKKNPPTQFVGKDAPASPASDAPATASASPAPAAPASDAVTAGGLVWTPPKGWTFRPPSSSMRVLELVAPLAEGAAEPAELVVLTFGPTGAGSVEDNLERWARQVHDGEGAPVIPEVATAETGTLRLTTLYSTGVFLAGMPGQQPTPKPEWGLFAAIVENGPQGPVYVRVTGPRGAMERHRPELDALLRSLRPAE